MRGAGVLPQVTCVFAVRQGPSGSQKTDEETVRHSPECLLFFAERNGMQEGEKKTIRKGEIITGTVERVKFPNKGILHLEDGSVCVVKNTVPGQVVQARVTKRRKGRYEAALLEVTGPAPCERDPGCPHFGQCGGCTFLNLPYEEELKIKEGEVRELLHQALVESAVRAAGDEESAEALHEPGAAEAWADKILDERFEPILPSPVQYGYRNKMEFTFGDEYKDGPLALGMHKRGSFYDLVTVDGCRIVDEDYSRILRATRDYFAQKGLPYFHRVRHEGYLRHLLLRKASGTGEILLDLVTTTQQDFDLSEYVQLLLSLPLDGHFAGILHTRNDSVADTVRDEGTEILYGQGYFTETLLGLKFHVTPFSFFQTNSKGAEVLYQTAQRYLQDINLSDGVVYDLYCGTGTITQLMARSAKKVIGVEIVEEAVEAARANAQENGVENVSFIAGDVLKVLDQIEEKPDLIILDPPRDGVHPKALPRILGYGVEHILYISCKPTSLARDLPAFLEAGYGFARGVCVDQFPWTTGVESIALLSRVK